MQAHETCQGESDLSASTKCRVTRGKTRVTQATQCASTLTYPASKVRIAEEEDQSYLLKAPVRDFEAWLDSNANAKMDAPSCPSARTSIVKDNTKPEGTHDRNCCKKLGWLIDHLALSPSALVAYAAWLLVLYSAFNSNSPLEGPRVICIAILSRIFFMDSTDCLVSALSSFIFHEGCKPK